MHVVRPGEPLSKIAEKLLGSAASDRQIANEVKRIWDLNSVKVPSGDPDVILPSAEATKPACHSPSTSSSMGVPSSSSGSMRCRLSPSSTSSLGTSSVYGSMPAQRPAIRSNASDAPTSISSKYSSSSGTSLSSSLDRVRCTARRGMRRRQPREVLRRWLRVPVSRSERLMARARSAADGTTMR